MVKTSIYKTENGRKLVMSFYDNLLLQWQQPSQQFTIDTSLGETFIIESGEKGNPPIILLHGSGSNSAMWTADAKELSKKFNVFAVDIIGECGKSAELRPPFKDTIYSGWISEIIEKLGLGKISVIACSLGGWLALDFAIRFPDKIEKLVLLASAGIVQVKPKTIFWIIITSLLGNWGFNKLNKMVYGNLEIDNKALEFASLLRLHYKPRTDVLPVFKTESLRKITVPTLYIGGEHDCFYHSEKAAERLNSSLENVQCFVRENTGHVLVNQVEAIVKFLNS